MISKWFRLDNAANIYPHMSYRRSGMVYRIAAVIKTDVDRAVLNAALEETIGRFPSFKVSIKKGIFWYYLDSLDKKIYVEDTYKYPGAPLLLDGKHYMFRIVAEKNLIGIEAYHSITDGIGATKFLISLITRYYELKNNCEVSEYINALNVSEPPKSAEVEDSYYKNAEKGNYAKRDMPEAYKLKLTHGDSLKIFNLIVDVDELKTKAKSYNATVTELLCSVFLIIMHKIRAEEGINDKPIVFQVPIDLRGMFNSCSVRNCAYVVAITSENATNSLEEMIEQVKTQFKLNSTKEKMQQAINTNVRDERNKLISLTPLFIKRIGFRLALKMYAHKGFSMSFSNLGYVKAPLELNNIIDRLNFIIKPSRPGNLFFSGIAYNKKCTLTFASTCGENDIIKDYVRYLTDLGLNIVVDTNY